MAKRSYYEILGVAEDADPATIKKAFRRLAFERHPDRNPAPDAEERFKEIAEAYAVLSDPAKRRVYDRGGHAGVAGYSAEDLYGGLDLDDLLRGFGFGAGDLFERFFGLRRGLARGADLQAEIVVPLATVIGGGEETITIRRPAACATCGGSGAAPGTGPRACPDCGGTGERVRRLRRGGIMFQQVGTCQTCGGRGRVIDSPCPECRGEGRVVQPHQLRVSIPMGIEDGMALRLAGQGTPSPEAGGRPGDLLVVVRVAEIPGLIRDGADLWAEVVVPVVDAVLGTRVAVPTPEGEQIEIDLPAGSQPGQELRLAGRGLPPLGGGRRSDLRVRVRVRIPDRLSAEARALYEGLRALDGGGPPARAPSPTRLSLRSRLKNAWQRLGNRSSVR